MSIEYFHLIDLSEEQSLLSALLNLQLLADGETVESAEPAGDGNMNLVTRVVTDRRSFIIKQSRPWVEKFPDIAAPADRILAELDFYRRVSQIPALAARMPRLLGCDTKNRLLAIEDLGAASDYSDLYCGDSFPQFPMDAALSWLARLHDVPIAREEVSSIGNQELRELNHAHLFDVPFQSPAALDLDAICPGLSQLAMSFQQDELLQAQASELGRRYLVPQDSLDSSESEGFSLLHGDFYPGSWLRNAEGTWIIDPEFCFVGDPEFDLAVLAAHTIFCGGHVDSIEAICQSYSVQRQADYLIDRTLLDGWVGVELIRRLLGVAQLPLVADLERRATWLSTARQLIIG